MPDREQLRLELDGIRAQLANSLEVVEGLLEEWGGAPQRVELEESAPQPAKGKRKTLGMSEFRDAVCGRTVPVRASVLAEELNVTKGKVVELGDILVGQGILKRLGQERDPAYQYIEPEGGGPTEREEHEPRVRQMAGAPLHAGTGGPPVAGAGRPGRHNDSVTGTRRPGRRNG